MEALGTSTGAACDRGLALGSAHRLPYPVLGRLVQQPLKPILEVARGMRELIMDGLAELAARIGRQRELPQAADQSGGRVDQVELNQRGASARPTV